MPPLVPTAASIAARMNLEDFQDEDLGPGGKFTTRWGADPIRENNTPIGPFLQSEALVDLTDPSVDYISSIAVPLDDLREREESAAAGKPLEKLTYETLMASLTTYTPRFDVESEKWFVDVTLNPDTIVEPFVRLGLVRYQAEARESLRVSAPVKFWAQVLPNRSVEAFASKSRSGEITLTVHVSGRAAGRSKDDSGKGSLVLPRMRISVTESSETLAKMTSERVAEAKGSPHNVPAVQWAEGSPADKYGSWMSSLTWVAQFLLPAKSSGDRKPRPFSILVEEVEDFVSTADEPANPPTISTQDGTTKKESGGASGNETNVATRTSELPPTDIWIIAGDEVEAGLERTGPRFLSKIEIEV